MISEVTAVAIGLGGLAVAARRAVLARRRGVRRLPAEQVWHDDYERRLIAGDRSWFRG